MYDLTRRSFFAGLGAFFAAPAIVRASSLMSVKSTRNILLSRSYPISTLIMSASTSANFKAFNKSYEVGVYCYETDTGYIKIGDGISLYSALPYHIGPMGRM